MGAPKVTVREIDLSTRVPSFPGVYGGMAIPALKGPLEPTLVTTDKDLLRLYTPDSEVKVTYDNSYFSALAYLQGSDKLWVNRAINTDALYGGLFVFATQSASANDHVAAGLAIAADPIDPPAYTFGAESFVLYGLNPGAWNNDISIKIFDFHAQEDLAVGDFAEGTDIITTRQKWNVGDDVKFQKKTNASTLPTNLAFDTTYYVTVPSGNTFKLASTLALAIAGTPIDFTGSGSNTVVLMPATNHCPESGKKADATASAFWEAYFGEKAVPTAFSIEVYWKGTLVETFAVSKSTVKDGFNRSMYIVDMLKSSEYIRCIDNTAVTTDMVKTMHTGIYMEKGTDGTAVTDAELVVALDGFESPDAIPLTLLMDGGAATVAVAQQIIAVAEARRDCFGILSTPYANEASASYLNELINYRKIDLNANTSFAALFTPHLKVYDKFNDRSIYCAPDGNIGAIISKTALNYEIWYPPAGFRRGILNVLDVRRRFQSGEMDLLYDAGLNPVRFVPGKGIVVWGQKTLSARPSALDRINVRMLLIVIEPAIKEALEDFTFEINDAATQSVVRIMIAAYMANIKSRRGVYDFSVVCDATNNTATDIDNYRLNVDLFVKPVKAIEFIRFTVVIVPTGMAFGVAKTAV